MVEHKNSGTRTLFRSGERHPCCEIFLTPHLRRYGEIESCMPFPPAQHHGNCINIVSHHTKSLAVLGSSWTDLLHVLNLQ